MGHHQCSYVAFDEAIKIGTAAGMTQKEVENAYKSSRETTLEFSSGNKWQFPDMLPLYIALGYRPEQAFIDDISSGKLINCDVIASMGSPFSFSLDIPQDAKPVGYLKGEALPPADPSFINPFIARLREVREEGETLSEPSRDEMEALRKLLDDFDPFPPRP